MSTGERIGRGSVGELMDLIAERMRAMTQWEAGDYFELRCRGRVAAAGTGADQTKMCLHLWGDEHSTLDYGRAVYAPDSWFDEHATKIERPLEFGQRVKIPGARTDIYRVLEHFTVEGGNATEGGDDLVLVWPEGAGHVEQYPRHRLSPLLDDAPSAE